MCGKQIYKVSFIRMCSPGTYCVVCFILWEGFFFLLLLSSSYLPVSFDIPSIIKIIILLNLFPLFPKFDVFLSCACVQERVYVQKKKKQRFMKNVTHNRKKLTEIVLTFLSKSVAWLAS